MKYLLRWIILISLFAVTLQAETRLTLSLSDSSPYVGEPILATYTLRSDHPIGGRDPFEVKFPGWWSAPMEEGNVSDDGRTIRWVYRLSPQHSGTLLLPAQSLATTHMDPKTYAVTRALHHTSDQRIDVRTLPTGVSIVGDFQLHETIEHNSTEPNMPAVLTVTVEGEGNIDDMPPFDLNLTEALVLASKPERSYTRKKGKLHAFFRQRLTIVSGYSMTILPLSLTLFNPNTQLVEILKSAPFHIKVTEKSMESNTGWLLWLVGLGAFSMGISVVWLWSKRPRSGSTQLPLAKKLRAARNDKELYHVLLPYADNQRIRPFLRKLEANIFKGSKEKIDRKMIKKILKNL